jgi:hypothetical protein
LGAPSSDWFMGNRSRPKCVLQYSLKLMKKMAEGLEGSAVLLYGGVPEFEEKKVRV